MSQLANPKVGEDSRRVGAEALRHQLDSPLSRAGWGLSHEQEKPHKASCRGTIMTPGTASDGSSDPFELYNANREAARCELFTIVSNTSTVNAVGCSAPSFSSGSWVRMSFIFREIYADPDISTYVEIRKARNAERRRAQQQGAMLLKREYRQAIIEMAKEPGLDSDSLSSFAMPPVLSDIYTIETDLEATEKSLSASSTRTTFCQPRGTYDALIGVIFTSEFVEVEYDGHDFEHPKGVSHIYAMIRRRMQAVRLAPAVGRRSENRTRSSTVILDTKDFPSEVLLRYDVVICSHGFLRTRWNEYQLFQAHCHMVEARKEANRVFGTIKMRPEGSLYSGLFSESRRQIPVAQERCLHPELAEHSPFSSSLLYWLQAKIQVLPAGILLLPGVAGCGKPQVRDNTVKLSLVRVLTQQPPTWRRQVNLKFLRNNQEPEADTEYVYTPRQLEYEMTVLGEDFQTYDDMDGDEPAGMLEITEAFGPGVAALTKYDNKGRASDKLSNLA
ncbi:hypothetical protein FALBO_7827 [Fusarium albosuccineum]|uniref:Uncharacterized protein n=1 Tax=Fusarium albosuccineum TaxID=1237068 RepID=A0A8H4LAK9_9HYPO|nr:hypothetical protein FALBO_7827 [Fusarium albosuccineum]